MYVGGEDSQTSDRRGRQPTGRGALCVPLYQTVGSALCSVVFVVVSVYFVWWWVRARSGRINRRVFSVPHPVADEIGLFFPFLGSSGLLDLRALGPSMPVTPMSSLISHAYSHTSVSRIFCSLPGSPLGTRVSELHPPPPDSPLACLRLPPLCALARSLLCPRAAACVWAVLVA